MATGEQEADAATEPREPRDVLLVKGPKGFGFNIRGQVSEGGKMKPINGQLYAPLQYISAVVEGGPAAEANVKPGDRLLAVNDVVVEGVEHQRVVDLIRSSGKKVKLSLVSVTKEEASRLEMESTPNADAMDMRSVPLSIPDLEKRTGEDGKEYVVYNIHFANRQVASRRFREFFALDGNLKRQFVGFAFPPLPGRWPFKMSDVAIDGRRRKLQEYLEKVCMVRMIFESDLIQDFMELSKNRQNLVKAIREPAMAEQVEQVDLRVFLPDGTTETVDVQVHVRTSEVCNTLGAKIGLREGSLGCFALFKEDKSGFLSKLTPSEFPCKVVECGQSILLRKWVFSPQKERNLFGDPRAVDLLFDQANADIKVDKIKVTSSLQETLDNAGTNPVKFLMVLQGAEDYNTVTFPHCTSDARKNGHVAVAMDSSRLQLHACDAEGKLEGQSHEFTWDHVKVAEADIEAEAFMVQYEREGKPPKWMKIFSPHYEYMAECSQLIKEERRELS